MPIAAAMIFFYLPNDINQDLEVNGLNITQAAEPPTSRLRIRSRRGRPLPAILGRISLGGIEG